MKFRIKSFKMEMPKHLQQLKEGFEARLKGECIIKEKGIGVYEVEMKFEGENVVVRHAITGLLKKAVHDIDKNATFEKMR